MQKADVLGSALDPLLPLQRWIQYTQVELQSLRSDCRHQFEQIESTGPIQQSQLDALQKQVAQQQHQVSEEATEIATTVADFCKQLQNLQTTLSGLVQDVMTHFSSQQQMTLPATQLAVSQPDLP